MVARKTKKDTVKSMMSEARKTHAAWYDFCDHFKKWYFTVERTFHIRPKGKNSEDGSREIKFVDGKRKYREFDCTKMAGHLAMKRVDAYAKKHPEIRVVMVDDAYHASSSVVLIPHPTMGITAIYVPQCATDEKNQFFLYPSDAKPLARAIGEMTEECEKACRKKMRL